VQKNKSSVSMLLLILTHCIKEAKVALESKQEKHLSRLHVNQKEK
jgi:hypothetical protein